MRRLHPSTGRCTKWAAWLEHFGDLMMGIKGDKKTGRQVTRALLAGGPWWGAGGVLLKIAKDVMKDKTSRDADRQGSFCGTDLWEEKMIFTPTGCHMTCSQSGNDKRGRRKHVNVSIFTGGGQLLHSKQVDRQQLDYTLYSYKDTCFSAAMEAHSASNTITPEAQFVVI